jgi:hypothetical protein
MKRPNWKNRKRVKLLPSIVQESCKKMATLKITQRNKALRIAEQLGTIVLQ